MTFAPDKDKAEKIWDIKLKFWWFALIASLNHALNYVVNSYATSLLSTNLGGVILGLSWVLNSVSGLTVATPIVLHFGFKYAMIISLVGYAVQLGTLFWAVMTTDITTKWVVAVSGSIFSGFTSAVWWTAQGVYFDDVCVRIAALGHTTDDSKESHTDDVRAEIAASWTVIYQTADIVVFLSLSLFPIIGVVSINGVVGGLAVLGVVTAALGFTFESIGNGASLSWNDAVEAVAAVPIQIRDDARVSLLAPFVFGFGITTAMFSYYVNDDVISDSSDLGTVYLGFLEAWSYFVAIVSAYPYSFASKHLPQGQDWVIQFGSLAFLVSGAVVLGLTNAQLSTWSNIIIAKGLYGLGRGVFEGSCRVVYVAKFKGKDLITAFSGQTLSAGLSGGICFFLFGIMSRTGIAAVTVVNGVVAILAYFILMYAVDSNKPVSWSRVVNATCLCNTEDKASQPFLQQSQNRRSDSNNINHNHTVDNNNSEDGRNNSYNTFRSSDEQDSSTTNLLH